MKFEQLDVWQRSFRLSVQVYKLFKDLNDFGFKNQLCRSSVSIPSNIAEGMERASDKEKARFLSIAKGSCGELKTQVMIAAEIGYVSPEMGSLLTDECEQISKMLGGFMQTLKHDKRI